MTSAEIKELPSYKKLVKRRSKMIWGISLALVITLMANLYLMSFGADLGSRPIVEYGTLTVLVFFSTCSIFIGAFLAGFYVLWANRYLDPLITQVNQDISEKA